ncbi:histidine phosphatase family protein [Hasllibacter sp. MH4015]|uniref:histidine phosphatase family protein n=1 Tax=Hasllibacter sp. MH4015 TaxID=2854029 RepID=UPI001CD545CA|nr:histidine phosphatase family protein [Hasllibacter sp. MH4015]
MTFRIALTLSPLLPLLAALPALAQDAAPSDLIEALQDGGHVVYIRHAQTESDYADQVTADPQNCATQRVLSRTGWQQALHIGAMIEGHGIPVGDVLSSEYCRAWQTAGLAFGTFSETSALNFEPAEEYTDAQFEAMRARVEPLIAAPIAEGTNRVIVGHDDPFEAVTGIYPEPQGVAYVLRVADGQVEVLGAIGPDAWPQP